MRGVCFTYWPTAEVGFFFWSCNNYLHFIRNPIQIVVICALKSYFLHGNLCYNSSMVVVITCWESIDYKFQQMWTLIRADVQKIWYLQYINFENTSHNLKRIINTHNWIRNINTHCPFHVLTIWWHVINAVHDQVYQLILTCTDSIWQELKIGAIHVY